MEQIKYTQEQVNEIDNRLLDIGLDETNPTNQEKLGQLIVGYFGQHPEQFSVENVVNLVRAHQSEFIWFSAARRAFNKLQLREQDKQTILSFVPSRGLKSDDDSLWINATLLAEYWLKSGVRDLDTCLQRVTNSVHGYKLAWKPRLQDDEKEAQRIKQEQAAKQQPKNNDSDVPSYVPANRREHWRSLHGTDSKPATPTTTPTNEYQQRSLDAINSIPSVVDREQATEYLKKGWPSEVAYQEIMRFIERRNQQRWLSGR